MLEWFRSYLKERSFTVLIGDKSSSKGYLWFGVPQGSILGPILFILYTKALQRIAKKYGILIQLYADDSQLYIGFRANDPLSVSDAVRRIEECLREIKEWIRDNFMKLNKAGNTRRESGSLTEHTGRERPMRPPCEALTPCVFDERTRFLAHRSHSLKTL